MLLAIACFWLVPMVFCGSGSMEVYNKLNLVQVNMSDTVYKRLMITNDKVLSATPLAMFDVQRFAKYKCFKNIRRNLWSFRIPVVFWNKTYMDQIKKSIQQSSQVKGLNADNFTILPPSGFLAYRLTWRRRSLINNDEEEKIILDSSWNDAQTDYVLPMRHSFLVEFREENTSSMACSEIKEILTNESFQISEFAVEFQKKISKNQTIPKISIKIDDLRSVSIYDQSGCKLKSKNQCLVSKAFAEKWAYEVSTEMLKNTRKINLNLQKDVYDEIYMYLCKSQVSIDSVGVKRLQLGVEEEMACQIPNEIFVMTKKVCSDRYNSYPYQYQRYENCRNETVDMGNLTIVRVKPLYSFKERNQFSIPIQAI